MTPSIADRIAIVVGPTGCALKALRAALSDIHSIPLDCALQGLITAGHYVLNDDGCIRPRLAASSPQAHQAPEMQRLHALFEGGR